MNQKVMIIVPRFAPCVGGVENYAFQIAQQLQQKYKVKIIVITTNTEEKKEKVEYYSGMKVYRLSVFRIVSNSPIHWVWFKRIKQIIREEKPILINAYAPVPGIADIAAFVKGNTPFVLSYHAGTMKKGKFLPDCLIWLYEHLILPHTARKATKIICSSNFVRTGILKKFQYKSTIIHPGVDTILFTPSTTNRIPGRVLFISRYKSMFAIKGLPYLIEAVKRVSGAQLYIIGEKDRSEDSRIVYAGVKQSSEIVKEMQLASVFVLPSLADKESFGMVLLEAMATKTPVIGTNGGGIPEIIHDGENGLLVPEKDAAALADALQKILFHEDIARKMGESGYRQVQSSFTWESRGRVTYQLFQSVLAL